MPRISYVNGQYIRHAIAGVHIEDRGFQFADGVYEVVVIVNGHMVDEKLHFERLKRSLCEIRMEMPFGLQILKIKVTELLRLNKLSNALLYIQVTRGVAPRSHPIPTNTQTSVIMTVRSLATPKREWIEKGVNIVTVPDIRWRRSDIKSIALLPNVLAKDDAIRLGAFEAWQVDEHGKVTEGASTNAWIVRDGKVITYPAENAILNGITRQVLLKIISRLDIEVEKRPFSVGEAMNSDEAFLTSSTSFLIPVVQIDGKQISNGAPGPIVQKLLSAYSGHVWNA